MDRKVFIPPTKTCTLTYIKFDSAPSSASDYDYFSEYFNGSGVIHAKNGSLSSTISFSGKTCVYVWGKDVRGTGGEYLGQIKINGTLMYGGYSYSTAECFQLSDNVELLLGYCNTDTSSLS